MLPGHSGGDVYAAFPGVVQMQEYLCEAQRTPYSWPNNPRGALCQQQAGFIEIVFTHLASWAGSGAFRTSLFASVLAFNLFAGLSSFWPPTLRLAFCSFIFLKLCGNKVSPLYFLTSTKSYLQMFVSIVRASGKCRQQRNPRSEHVHAGARSRPSTPFFVGFLRSGQIDPRPIFVTRYDGCSRRVCSEASTIERGRIQHLPHTGIILSLSIVRSDC